MPIRLRLAVAFALAAAALFALGGWLFASGLSSAQLKTIDSQLTAQLAQTGPLPAGRRLPDAGHRPSRPCPERERRRRKRRPGHREPAEPGPAGPDLADADHG